MPSYTRLSLQEREELSLGLLAGLSLRAMAARLGRAASTLSREIEKTERISASRRAKGERKIWQRRYWEHLIRDEIDFARHVDYIHFNPVKHGYVAKPADWPHSSIHRYVASGRLPADWAGTGTEVRECGERSQGLLAFAALTPTYA